MDERCIWCHGREGELKQIELVTRNRIGLDPKPRTFTVHAGHEREFVAFHEKVQRHGRAFLVALLVVLLGLIPLELALAAANPGLVLVGAGLASVLLGALLVALPFGTPETLALLGARRSISIVRICGLGVAVFGIVLILWGRA